MSAGPARWALVAAVVSTLASARADATQRFGPIQIAGNLQTQNLVRHPDESTYEFIQNRNTVHLQLDYDWLQKGRFYGKYDIPFIESSHLLLKYRGSYDSIYDTTPGFIQKEDIHGHAYSGHTLYEFAKLKGNAAGRPGFARRVLTLEGLTQG